MSKAAEKNKKKRAKKREQKCEEDCETEVERIHNPLEDLKAKIEEAKLNKDHKKTQELRSQLWKLQDEVLLGTSDPLSSVLPASLPAAPVKEPVVIEGDCDRELKTLYKKLKQIEALKERKEKGEKLQVNQLEKLSREQGVREEIAELEQILRQFSLT